MLSRSILKVAYIITSLHHSGVMLPSHHVILVLSLLFYAKELQPHLIDRLTGIIGKIINKLSHLFLVSLILPRIVRLMSGYFFNFIEFSLIMLLFLLIRTHSENLLTVTVKRIISHLASGQNSQSLSQIFYRD